MVFRVWSVPILSKKHTGTEHRYGEGGVYNVTTIDSYLVRYDLAAAQLHEFRLRRSELTTLLAMALVAGPALGVALSAIPALVLMMIFDGGAEGKTVWERPEIRTGPLGMTIYAMVLAASIVSGFLIFKDGVERVIPNRIIEQRGWTSSSRFEWIWRSKFEAWKQSLAAPAQ